MNQSIAAALIAIVATVASLPTAPAVTAHESYSDVHIERQCYRFGDFCGTPAKVYKKRHGAKKRVARAKSYKRRTTVTYGSHDKRPFIERQCARFGHFC